MLTFNKNITIFKRCTDDEFVFWKKQREHYNEFEEFKKTLNAISDLNW